MSQDTEIEEKRQSDFHNHALKGDLREIGAIPLAHDQEENNPNSTQSKEKKRLKDEFMRVVTDLAQDAFNNLMGRLNAELNTLRTAITQLEGQMEDNRKEWDDKVDILNEIDDVFCDMEDGGNLDQTRASEIIQRVSKEVPVQITDAKMISLLESIRVEALDKIETLDTSYLAFERNLQSFREREDKIIAAKQSLVEIGDNSKLDDQQKTEAIQKLDTELGSKMLHSAASIIQDQEVSQKADEVVKSNWDARRSEKIVAPHMPPAI